MPPAGAAYNIDWVLSTANNAHVASHTEWFTSYVPFETHISCVLGGAPISVEGIGTVSIPLKAPSRNHIPKTIVLHDVLYAPTLIANVISVAAFSQDYVVDFPRKHGTGFLLKSATRGKVGIVEWPVIILPVPT